jgi:hypothetical protein
MQPADSDTTEADEPAILTYRLPVGTWHRVLARLSLAVTCSLCIIYFLALSLPRTVVRRSDIAGSTTATGFDITRLHNRYLVWTVVAPLICLAIYHFSPRVIGRLRPSPNDPVVEIHRHAEPARNVNHSSVWRGSTVGGVLGLEAGIVGGRWWHGPSIGLIVLGAVLGGLMIAAARRLCERRSAPATLVSTLVIVGGLAAIAGLSQISRYTWVAVASTQTKQYFRWLPLWSSLALTVSAGLATANSWRRHGHDHAQRQLTVFGVGAVAVFILTARLPGLVQQPDLFHSGEQLVGGALLRDGLFPWRDFLAIHGLMNDSFTSAIGTHAFGDSYWALAASTSMYFTPLCLVGLYTVNAYVLRSNTLLTWFSGAALVWGGSISGGMLAIVHTRFVLYPFVLVALMAFLRIGSLVRGLIFSASLFVLAFCTPEAAYAVFAFPAVIFLSEFAGWRRGTPLLRRFRRTGIMAATGLFLLTIMVAVLLKADALDDFAYSITTFAVDHSLTGAFPLRWEGFTYAVAAYGVPVAIVLTFGIAVWRRRSSRGLRPEDWAMAGVALMLIPYYTKFLDRADGHVYQPWAVALVLVPYLLATLIERVEGGIAAVGLARRGPSVRTALGAGICLSLAFPWTPVIRSTAIHLTRAARQFQPVVQADSLGERFGFVDHTTLTDDEVPDLRKLLIDRSEGPMSVFDFTNSPALFHYFLALPTTTRYFHVSMAIRQRNQADLLAELAARPPDVVAMDSRSGGLPAWDGIPNAVRHYDVSEWLLRHYRPWARLYGLTLFARADRPLPTTDGVSASVITLGEDLATAEIIPECPWYQLGERLPIPADNHPDTVAQQPVRRLVDVIGWAASDGRVARRVYAVVDGAAVATSTLQPGRPDVARATHLPDQTPVGFAMAVPANDSTDAHVVVEWLDGSFTLAVPLSGPAQPPTLVFDLNGVRQTATGTSGGLIESTRVQVADSEGTFAASEGRRFRLDALSLPTNFRDFSWLTIAAPNGNLPPGLFRLSDSLIFSSGNVSFSSVLRDSSVSIQVASCPQWHDVRLRRLYLRTEPAAGDVVVTLSRGSQP